MMRWAKCWARKSPAYVKNLGNIRVENSPILAGKNPRKYVCAGLTRYLTSITSRAVYSYTSTRRSTMEFPPETYDVFEANQFETARERLAGDAVM
jgi:hypothetical protein